jgi:hypothetical protein
MFVSQSGEGVLIVDAGGGTIDLSAYRMTEAQNCFEEIARGTCADPDLFSHLWSIIRMQAISRGPRLSVTGLAHSLRVSALIRLKSVSK